MYGIFTTGTGATEVELAPQIPYGEDGDVLYLPSFGSKVNFQANAYGVGGTLVYGFGRNCRANNKDKLGTPFFLRL